MLDELVSTSELVIDRPAGSRHQRYPDLVYGVDNGYLAGTSSMDLGGIDVWRGTNAGAGLVAIMVTVDMVKRDSEIKLLIDAMEDEIKYIANFHNNSDRMKGLLIRRE
jgi:inorganic pyrophosphatase